MAMRSGTTRCRSGGVAVAAASPDAGPLEADVVVFGSVRDDGVEPFAAVRDSAAVPVDPVVAFASPTEPASLPGAVVTGAPTVTSALRDESLVDVPRGPVGLAGRCPAATASSGRATSLTGVVGIGSDSLTEGSGEASTLPGRFAAVWAARWRLATASGTSISEPGAGGTGGRGRDPPIGPATGGSGRISVVSFA
jgi:hypothetical protein